MSFNMLVMFLPSFNSIPSIIRSFNRCCAHFFSAIYALVQKTQRQKSGQAYGESRSV